MNYSSLALGFAFAAIAMAFIGRAKKESDPAQQRNKRFAGIMFLFAGAIFFVTVPATIITSD